MDTNWKLSTKDLTEIKILNNLVHQANKDYAKEKSDNYFDNYFIEKKFSKLISTAIENFNYEQKYNITSTFRKNSNTKSKLIDYYCDNCCIVQATKAKRKVNNNSFGVKYEKAFLLFSELYKSVNTQDFNYNELNKLLSSIEHMIVEKGKNKKRALEDAEYAKQNKFNYYSTVKCFGRELNIDDVKNNKKIGNVLNKVISYIFNYNKIVFNEKNTQFFISNMRSNNIESLVNAIFLRYAKQLKEIDAPIFATGEVKRHISWCIYEKKRYCSLLNEECHSAVGCIFYKPSVRTNTLK